MPKFKLFNVGTKKKDPFGSIPLLAKKLMDLLSFFAPESISENSNDASPPVYVVLSDGTIGSSSDDSGETEHTKCSIFVALQEEFR